MPKLKPLKPSSSPTPPAPWAENPGFTVNAPLLYRDELVAELVRHRSYLLEHRKHLERYGTPPVAPRGTCYVFRHVQHVYATNPAPVIKDGKAYVAANLTDPDRPKASKNGNDLSLSGLRLIPYERAPRIKGLPWDDALCAELEILRSWALDAQSAVLETLVPFVINGSAAGLLRSCLSHIRTALKQPSVLETFLQADRLALSHRPKTDLGLHVARPLLSRLFALIEWIEFEVKTGSFSDARTLLHGLETDPNMAFLRFRGRTERLAVGLDALNKHEPKLKRAFKLHQQDFRTHLNDSLNGLWKPARAFYSLDGPWPESGGLVSDSDKDAMFKGRAIVNADCRSVSVDGKQYAKLTPRSANYFKSVLEAYLTQRTAITHEEATEDLYEKRSSEIKLQALYKDCPELRKVVVAQKGTKLLVGLNAAIKDRKIIWTKHKVVDQDGHLKVEEMLDTSLE